MTVKQNYDSPKMEEIKFIPVKPLMQSGSGSTEGGGSGGDDIIIP